MMAVMSTLIDRLGRLAGIERRFAAGSTLFRRDDPVRALHLVRDGMVHLVRHREDGGTLMLQRAGRASVLAEASLYAKRYHCDAVCVLTTRTRAISCATLRAALGRDPELAAIWATHLAREVQSTRLRAEILALRTVAQRLDSWIATNDGRLPPKGSWQTIAAEIGTSREALYRELARRR